MCTFCAIIQQMSRWDDKKNQIKMKQYGFGFDVLIGQGELIASYPYRGTNPKYIGQTVMLIWFQEQPY